MVGVVLGGRMCWRERERERDIEGKHGTKNRLFLQIHGVFIVHTFIKGTQY